MIVKPSLCKLSVKITDVFALDAEIASTLTSCAWVAVLSESEVAVRAIVSVPAAPSTVSAATKPLMTSSPEPTLMLSAPEAPVIVSATELPVIVKPSLCKLSVIVTAVVEVDAEIASILTS